MLRFALVFVGTVLAIGLVYRIVLALVPGVIVTSWWRTPGHNADIGGVPNSLHLLGLAWDVVPASQDNAAKLRALGLHVIDEGNHLHAQFFI